LASLGFRDRSLGRLQEVKSYNLRSLWAGLRKSVKSCAAFWTARAGRYVAGIGRTLRPQHFRHAPRHPRRMIVIFMPELTLTMNAA
jgi:hypothetical protein